MIKFDMTEYKEAKAYLEEEQVEMKELSTDGFTLIALANSVYEAKINNE
tara:strand:- start:942 stop:1088 length:147 start_codon:yes stop_codon:yes gene_type:complete